MDKIRITGGTPLSGEVQISGSKNASLPLMAATLLAESASHVERIPRLADVANMTQMLEHLGAKVQRTETGLDIDPSGFHSCEAPYDLMRRMRASIYVMGPMLARFGHAQVSLPGGCAIGTRPVDLHLKGMEALGAEIEIEHGYIKATVPNGLKGADCNLSGASGPSVGATCNVLMATVLAKGHSTLRGVAREPHIDDLVEYLNKMGAQITGKGTSVLEVDGVDSLNGVDYCVIPDQIEAGTFLIAAAVTNGDITLRHCRPDHMETEIEKFGELGGQIDIGADGRSIRARGDRSALRPVAIRTAPHPGFPTDLQAQYMVALALANGESTVIENVFPDRFMHAAEMVRMGADIHVLNGQATIHGVKGLSGASVMASDLRASAALVLAGLAAEGETEILRVYHLDRGYENLESKFQALGADIERVKPIRLG